MKDSQEKRKYVKRGDRITLDPKSVEIIDSWIDQLVSGKKGIIVNRADLVNWSIQSREKILTSHEMGELMNRYFDDVKFLQQALRDLQDAKAKGEATNIQELFAGLSVHGNSLADGEKRRRPRTSGKKSSQKLTLDDAKPTLE